MKPLLVIPFCLCLTLSPALGQDKGTATDDGMSLIEQGTRMLLRSLLDEVKPTLNDLSDSMETALAEMKPILKDLRAKIDDIQNYEAPEILPNGDIILRRKIPLDRPLPPAGPEIDL